MFTWLVHFGDIAFLTLMCHLFRSVCRQLPLPDKVRILLEEFISTLDFCGCCFETAFICETYGNIPFAFVLFIMCVWWGFVWGDAAVNPNKHLEDYVRGDSSLLDTGSRILVELLAGKVVFSIITTLWSLELSDDHEIKYQETRCFADLQVSVLLGAAVEFLLSFIDRFNALTAEVVPVMQSIFYTAALSTGLVVSALNYSGGYFNPVLATSLKYGCKGHNALEFFVVYWVASITGSMVALLLNLSVVRPLHRRLTKPKEE